MPTYSEESYSQPLDKVTFMWYIVTMTTRTTFEPVNIVRKKMQESDIHPLTFLKNVLYCY